MEKDDDQKVEDEEEQVQEIDIDLANDEEYKKFEKVFMENEKYKKDFDDDNEYNNQIKKMF